MGNFSALRAEGTLKGKTQNRGMQLGMAGVLSAQGSPNSAKKSRCPVRCIGSAKNGKEALRLYDRFGPEKGTYLRSLPANTEVQRDGETLSREGEDPRRKSQAALDRNEGSKDPFGPTERRGRVVQQEQFLWGTYGEDH